MEKETRDFTTPSVFLAGVLKTMGFEFTGMVKEPEGRGRYPNSWLFAFEKEDERDINTTVRLIYEGKTTVDPASLNTHIKILRQALFDKKQDEDRG